MGELLKSCMRGPDWIELSIPEWFPERAETLIAKIGEDHPDSKAFRKILTTGHVEERDIEFVDFIASKTQNWESIQLAADLSQHCFATIKAMTLLPLCTR